MKAPLSGGKHPSLGNSTMLVMAVNAAQDASFCLPEPTQRASLRACLCKERLSWSSVGCDYLGDLTVFVSHMSRLEQGGNVAGGKPFAGFSSGVLASPMEKAPQDGQLQSRLSGQEPQAMAHVTVSKPESTRVDLPWSKPVEARPGIDRASSCHRHRLHIFKGVHEDPCFWTLSCNTYKKNPKF